MLCIEILYTIDEWRLAALQKPKATAVLDLVFSVAHKEIGRQWHDGSSEVLNRQSEVLNRQCEAISLGLVYLALSMK